MVTDQGAPWKESGPDFYPHGLQIIRELAASVQIDGDEDGRAVWVLYQMRGVPVEQDALTDFDRVRNGWNSPLTSSWPRPMPSPPPWRRS